MKRVPALQEAGHELLRVESRKSQCAGTDVEVQLDVQLAPTSDELDAESLRAALEAALGAQVASASVPLPLTLPLPPSLSSRSEQQHPTRAIAAGRKSGACDSRDLSAQKACLYSYLQSACAKCAEPLLDVPWFPKSREELDLVAGHVIMYGPGLDADHPVGTAYMRLPAREQLFSYE